MTVFQVSSLVLVTVPRNRIGPLVGRADGLIEVNVRLNGLCSSGAAAGAGDGAAGAAEAPTIGALRTGMVTAATKAGISDHRLTRLRVSATSACSGHSH